jgi:outer membrane receptor protein involved in Fe transport
MAQLRSGGARDSGDRSERSAAEALMEEITITAQKREQPLQDVGIAVTAFTGQQIEQLGFQNSIDIVAHARHDVRHADRSRQQRPTSH